MSLDADHIIDRRRLSRRLSLWRIIAFVFAIVAVVALIVWVSPDLIDKGRPHVARVTIEGVILEDRGRDRMLSEIADNDAVKAVILAIDSPGGTTAGGEALYNELRRISGQKPVVATIRTVGASAAYGAAIAADQVFARETSITGSIGVLFQWADISDLFDTIGIDMETIKSDPLKAEPSPFEPATPEAKAVIEDLIEDSYGWFSGIVADRRGFSPADVSRLADGRIFSGRRAVDEGLIDAIGGEREARAWLAAEHGVDTELKIREWTPETTLSEFDFAESLLRAVGLDALLPAPPRLDGLVSVWHPQLIED